MSRRAIHREFRAGGIKSGGAPLATRLHGRLALQVFAFTAAAGVMLVSVVAPTAPQTAQAGADVTVQADADVSQSISVQSVTALQPMGRDVFEAKRYVPPVVVEETPDAADAPAGAKPSKGAPAAGSPDPGSAKAIAYDMVAARGWGVDQYDCLVSLWQKESGWNVYAHNASSGAYGIPQSLPGSKMATVGADWATNPATQITWGLNYIQGRYQDPCGAWGASKAKGWY